MEFINEFSEIKLYIMKVVLFKILPIHFRTCKCSLNPRRYRQTLTSAPLAPGIISATFLKLIPRVKFILRECILRISALACDYDRNYNKIIN